MKDKGGRRLFSVIDKNGNTAFSEEGYAEGVYTSFEKLGEQRGLVILKAVDGQTQVIDSYGNVIIPAGHEFSMASLLDQTGKMVDDYSMLYDETEDIYYFVDEYEHHVLEAHEPMDEQFAQQLFSGQGWILLDEEAEKLLAVVPSTDGYQICDVAALP